MPLFNRLRGVISGNQADVDPHCWKLPSSYSSCKPGGKQTVIPDPSIFVNAFPPTDAEVGNTATILACPDISHAAVHLALLECFRTLRLEASALQVDVHGLPAYTEKPRDDIPSTRTTGLPESQRWDLLIRLAVSRFAVWWTNIDHVLVHIAAYGHHAGDKVMVQLTKEYLPPLDVLLVWYAFMLDSDAYNAACRDHERRVARLEHLCFPWLAIRDVIDMDRFRFELPRTAQNLFSTLSTQSSDILTYLESPPAYTEGEILPFEADLFAEVKKQAKFIDDGHNLLWIRAPALIGSLKRASVEYSDYQLRGASLDSDGIDVPFGIDLFWRTHQLHPNHYRLFRQEIGNCRETSGSKAPMLQSVSSGSVIKDLQVVPGLCQCWTCERIRDDVPTFTHTPTPPTATSSSAPLPSSTNQQLSSLSSEQLRQIQDDLGFYLAVEKARQCGGPLPTRPPTAREKAAEATARAKQKEVGQRPGLNEYLEILPDGTRKIRRQKHVNAWGNWTSI
ncbi:hypothetical protein NCS57_01455400 [Fusarium keratoplasticum]|uniref:Uncharacterized protein n=1 Tax=Fusarium keratoplasticum TaxID=1328300 RepID=A0ACC0QEV1_9HYPO|nr:hypothetical protein NCS57_01455400 [Fusarium keratoplasticum]KAI8649192.1 hypothetical protein NCS57_01455400 [Fusarium keratoplasticum]KAI8649585.1 hypothetical protein NCS55_01458600 [Fusarium keratoplasticum]